VGAFKGCLGASAGVIVLGMVVIGALAMIGGLAAACFTKVFSIVFLGVPRRNEDAAEAQRTQRETNKSNKSLRPLRLCGDSSANLEPAAPMKWAMIVLAVGCVVVGLCGPLVILLPSSPAGALAGAGAADAASAREAFLTAAGPILWKVTLAALSLVAVVGLLVLLRRRLLAGRQIGSAGTWDCGYVAPTPRMQYTASSFAQPITNLFRMFLGLHSKVSGVKGLFPAQGRMSSHAPDVFLSHVFGPVFTAVSWTAMRLRWLQHGRLQLYILYIAVTLLVLMVWKLSG